MPSKPNWLLHLTEIIAALDQRPAASLPWIGRAEIESLLGVGRRRAQQILLSCPHSRLGRNLVASPQDFRLFLLNASSSTSAQSERLRRQRLAAQISNWIADYQLRPPLLVSAPASVRKSRLDSLPPGISLDSAKLEIHFNTRQDLLEKLLALSCALASEPDTPY